MEKPPRICVNDADMRKDSYNDFFCVVLVFKGVTRGKRICFDGAEVPKPIDHRLKNKTESSHQEKKKPYECTFAGLSSFCLFEESKQYITVRHYFVLQKTLAYGIMGL